MKIPFVKWSTYLMKKYLRYVYLFLFLLSLCFPFKPPHNTFNLIENFHLPSIAYPISYVLIFVFFILLVAKFSVPSVPSGFLIVDQKEQKIRSDEWSVPLSNISYHFDLKVLNYQGEKSVWKFQVQHPIEKELNLILDKEEKKKLEDILRAHVS